MGRVTEEIAERSQFLTFVSAGHDYAVPIGRMREIVQYGGSTKVPLAPRDIRGLINLRGRAIPVLDLAVRFGGDETAVTDRTCVLIVEFEEDCDRPDMGILADSVKRVIDIDPAGLEDTPSFGMGVSSEYLMGMVKSGDKFVPIIDVEQVLRGDDSLEAVFAGDADGAAEDGRREAGSDAIRPDADETAERDPEPAPEAPEPSDVP